MLYYDALSEKQVIAFQEKIIDFYKSQKRDLAWRYSENAYHILVSEFMLQQTQVSRVIGKFALFISHFPTIFDLAHATLADVLFCWQGLGYNRRAKYIHEAASIIVTDHVGIVPQEIAVLQLIPGIGPYTAAAIATFAYNRAEIFIETNIRTVFLHEFFKDSRNVNDAQLRPLIAQTLDHRDPRSWYYALMDYGSWLKKEGKNAARNSAHYSKQTPFSGSFRQLRGKVIKLLTQRGTMKIQTLKKLIVPEDIRLDDVVTSLIKEHMIEVKRGLLGIKNSNRHH